MKSLLFAFGEGLKGLKRAKTSSIIAVLTIGFSIVAFGIFGIVTLKFQSFISFVESKVNIEVYFDESVNKAKRNNIEKQLRDIPGIGEVLYVSREDASTEFEKNFGINIENVLNSNPLPPSFRLKLEKGGLKSSTISIIEEQIKQIDGVVEIINNRDLILLLAKYKEILITVGTAIGLILIIASVFLVSNTIKLSLLARADIINTMKLVGATKWFIRKPLIFEGIFQGFLGSIFGIAGFCFLIELINFLLKIELFTENLIHYGILLTTGILLGFIGSILAMARFLKF